jgi:hypothetical protein
MRATVELSTQAVFFQDLQMDQVPTEFFDRQCVFNMPAGEYMIVRGGPQPARQFCFSQAHFCRAGEWCKSSFEYNSVQYMKILLDGTNESDSRRLKCLEGLRFWNADDRCPEEAGRLLSELHGVEDREVLDKRHLLPSTCCALDLNTAHWLGDDQLLCHALVIRVSGYPNQERNKTIPEVYEELVSIGFVAERISTSILFSALARAE